MKDPKTIIRGAAVLAVVAAFSPLRAAAEEPLRELIRNRIEAAQAQKQFVAAGERVYAERTLPLFYERRGYRPAWFDNLKARPIAAEFVGAVRKADSEGLPAEHYHLQAIEQALNAVRGSRADRDRLPTIADAELLLTDAFLIYGSHLLSGMVNPERVHAEWFANRRQTDLAAVLEKAVDAGKVGPALAELAPPQRGYASLRAQLARYRSLAAQGGWERVADGPKMQLGDAGDRVDALRKRLAATDDFTAPPSDGGAFDEPLESAVERFQRRHGLDADGVVGRRTLAALNVSAAERVTQIAVNMERWRWLPQDLGKRYVIINIANFELDIVEGDSLVMNMRVVVGRPYRRTPVFSDKITYMVLNPYWQVPPTIANQDVLPAVRKDPDYLAKQKMKVFQGWGTAAVEIDPAAIEWSAMTIAHPYRFRQEPGPNNALGRVKFMFPNRFNVYMHDTPAKELLKKTMRSFSSGCIRVEKPLELAVYLLRGDPAWGRDAVLAAMDKLMDHTVPLPEPVAIHLLYWTAWVGDDDTLQFRDDIYQRDVAVARALYQDPSEAAAAPAAGQ